MEKDFKSWMVHGLQDVQLNVNPFALPFDAGLQNRSTSHAVPGVYNSVYRNGNYPITSFSFQPKTKETQPNHRLYHLPGFGQGFMSGENVVLNEKNVAGAQKVPPAYTSGCPPKQFLVFDQSGDKTTLIYSSGIDTPVCLNPWSSNSKPNLNCNSKEKEKIGVWSEIHASGPSLTEELNADYSQAEEQSEMREDTDEINALLYSDDEDASSKEEEDEDVVSTGHSPSVVTAYNDYKQDGFEVEDGEEVASSCGPVKRQRISRDGYNAPCLMDTAKSAKPSRNFQYEDDAESKCTDNCARYLNNNDDTDSVCGKKRSREDRIRETIEILQSIIPCSQGKGIDAALVLDESIRYLRSLRGKAGSLELSAAV